MSEEGYRVEAGVMSVKDMEIMVNNGKEDFSEGNSKG